MRRKGGPGKPRRRSDRGATMIEAAIVMPLIFLILFSVLEFGMLFRNYLTVTQITRDGARSASAFGRDFDADFRSVSIMANTAQAVTSGDIKRVVIWDATADQDRAVVPEVCKTAAYDDIAIRYVPPPSTDPTAWTNPIKCNIFTPDTWLDAQRYGCDDFANAADGSDEWDFDANWCPRYRDVSQTDGTDYVGVWVEFEHTWVTGLFGENRTITEQMIMRLEPKEF